MRVYIWLLCLIIGGSTAFMCNEIACDDSPLEELARLEYKPNKAELLHLCPPILDFFNCYFKGVKNCLGMDVKDIAESGDGMASVIADSLLKARSLAVVMCDKNSTLRKDYLENVECFDRVVNEGPDVCSRKGETYAGAFLRQWHDSEENVDWEELDCLERVYGMACFVEQVEITCGEVARKTFLTILEKVKSAVFTECDVENPLSLKRSFFEYLELYGEKSELYWYVFETFRRR